jgi:magnesium-transporting ATPase (P-type)
VSAAGEDVQPGEDQWEAPEAHALSVDQLARRLGTNPVAGLSEQDARARLDGVGPNALEQEARTPYARIALRQFADPLVALLLGAVVVSLAVGERVDAIAIAVIVLLNGALGFSQELAAERALVGLRETVKRRAMVIREGRERELPSEALVPGDLMVLREGERVAADGRIVLAEGLPVQESLLTGESVPADKSARAVAVGVPLADRVSMVFAGTAVTRGRGLALVTATGSRAEIGQVGGGADAVAAPARGSDQGDGRCRGTDSDRACGGAPGAGSFSSERVSAGGVGRGGGGAGGVGRDGHDRAGAGRAADGRARRDPCGDCRRSRRSAARR